MRAVSGGTKLARQLHGTVAGIARKSQALVMPEWQQKAEQGWWVPPARALTCSRSLRFGVTLVALVALAGILVPFLAPYAPDQIISGARLQAPSAQHPFGTDALGRDMLSRVGFGSHLAARMAVLSVGLSLCIGLVLGSLAGYYGGWLDQAISRVMDGWIALPGALVAIVIVARLGASFENLVIALGLMGVPAFYRIVRSSTMSMCQMPFVEAAISIGATNRRVMWLHVFPNILPSIVVLATLHMGTALLTGSSLSFIGLGAQPPLPEWGALLAAGKMHFETAWWLAAFPGLAVTLSVVGLNLLGDGLRDVLDPRFAATAEVRTNRAGDPTSRPAHARGGEQMQAALTHRREPSPAMVVADLDGD